MKKKIVGIFIFILLIGLNQSFILSANENYVSVLADDSNKKKDCECEPRQILADQNLLLNQIIINDTTTQLIKPTINNNLPPYFSWKDMNGTDWTTSAKDQGSCGSCWDFAAIGALESIIQIREGCAGLNLDLSEQYVLSCLPSAGSCNGGWAFYAYRYIILISSSGNYCNGIIPEFCFPYQVNDEVPCANVSPDWMDFLIPISAYGRWIPDGSVEDRNVIKTQIMESGPVVATMLFTIYSHGPNNIEEWGYLHNNPDDYYPYPGPIQGTNHQVVIVGWKDDLSITNGGYWIVKNSLSEEWGYNGFFNIEYGSLNIDSSDINWVDYDSVNYSNWMPVAQINGSSHGQTNQEMIFDGGNSFDHEGTIVSYIWNFGDGTNKTGIIVNHNYTQPGIYLVTLTVTDNASNTNNHSIYVYIDKENHPPKTPKLIGPRIGKNGTTYHYTISATDPDGDDVYYYLNWGDEYWFGGAVGWIGPFKSGMKITLEKTWEEMGNYTIRVKAKDQYDTKSNWATLSVSMPFLYDIPMQWFWHRLFERFPNLFPIIKHLIRL